MSPPALKIYTGPVTAWPQHDLDIGIVYTHERQYMTPLVDSLSRSGAGLAARLILIDNASADSPGAWTSTFADTIVVRNERRLHYAANLNRILSASTARYVLLLNTDMLFEPDEQCLTKMVQFMDAHPDCGLSSCRIHRPDGRYGHPARKFQTLGMIAARRLPWGNWCRNTIDQYFYRQRNHYDSFDCDWVSGCFLFLRREAWQEAGPLDEEFIKYFEDVDYCLRIGRAGWRVMLHGETYCYHFEGRASKKLFSHEAVRHLRSYLRWLRKWGFSPGQHAIAASASDLEVSERRLAA